MSTPNGHFEPIAPQPSEGNLTPTHIYEGMRDSIMQKPHRLLPTAVITAGVFAWYAMPDVLRSRSARTLTKAGLIGAFGWAAWERAKDFDDLTDYCSIELPENPCEGTDADEEISEIEPRELALAAGGLATSIVLTVAAEKWIFRRGEKARAQGKKGAHSRQALLLGTLTGISDLLTIAHLNPPKKTTHISDNAHIG